MKKIIDTIVIGVAFFSEKVYAVAEGTVEIEKGEISTEKIIGIIVILGGLALFVKMIQRARKY